jgi:hypothetical protein
LRRIPRRENRRTPYAQLGSIAKDDTELPMCCVNVPLKAVKTDRMQFLPGRQGKMPECPPCVGCLLIEGGAVYEPWVDHMVQVLNSKKVSRGNVGQMQKAEQQEARVEELHKKMDAIMLQPAAPRSLVRGRAVRIGITSSTYFWSGDSAI